MDLSRGDLNAVVQYSSLHLHLILVTAASLVRKAEMTQKTQTPSMQLNAPPHPHITLQDFHILTISLLIKG